MVYTRWKCDRLVPYGIKYFIHEYPASIIGMLGGCYLTWKYWSFFTEETERQHTYIYGYPWWRDPIQIKKQAKYVAMIRDNDIDILHPKWTGVEKEKLR